ncbi:hypothetical protein ACHAWF_006023 [Thalassiosira exigua]
MCQRQWSLRRWSSRTRTQNGYGSALIDFKRDVGAAASTSTLPPLSSSITSSQKTAKSSSRDEETPPVRLFSIHLTVKFISIAVLLSAAFAFSAGCLARMVLASKFGALPLKNDVAIKLSPERETTSACPRLPSPAIIPGKEVPYTTYTSKNFRCEGSSTSHTLHIDRRGAATQGASEANDDAQCEGVCSLGEDVDNDGNASNYDSLLEVEEQIHANDTNDYSHNNDSDGLHLPAGQHLLVDVKDVDSAFLDSELRLATAMVELINDSKLTLLSYHCHSLVPIGVSCVGVLLESHVAFHTWPKEGVIAMDLFTCGGNPLIPVLSSISKLFGIKRSPTDGEDEEDVPEPSVVWSHKLRGFREGFAPGYDRGRNPLDQDLGRYVLGSMDFDMKDQVVSTKTDFQSVDVYDVMYPSRKSFQSYEKSLSGGDSYEARNPEQFGPDRVLFLDGVIQSTLYGDAAYHESIVHPAMITHPNPERVAIIGGGEGATLREVLKHNTVEEAAMVEIDEGVVELSRSHLPQWQDCSAISHYERAAEWCFDDERVNAKFEDAMSYFIDNFYSNEGQGAKAYDVVIMDALDPNDHVEFAEQLYTGDTYIRSLYNALTENGILVVQVGESPTGQSPADETGLFEKRSQMTEKLEEVGFER